MLLENTTIEFLNKLASGEPVPGGGGASAAVGAFAAALGSMVSNLTIGKKKYADVEAEVTALKEQLQILQEELIRAGVLPEDYDFEAHKELVPMQAGDVPVTYADTSALERDYGYRPSTSLREGLRHFAEWYARFYK